MIRPHDIDRSLITFGPRRPTRCLVLRLEVFLDLQLHGVLFGAPWRILVLLVLSMNLHIRHPLLMPEHQLAWHTDFQEAQLGRFCDIFSDGAVFLDGVGVGDAMLRPPTLDHECVRVHAATFLAWVLGHLGLLRGSAGVVAGARHGNLRGITPIEMRFGELSKPEPRLGHSNSAADATLSCVSCGGGGKWQVVVSGSGGKWRRLVGGPAAVAAVVFGGGGGKLANERGNGGALRQRRCCLSRR